MRNRNDLLAVMTLKTRRLWNMFAIGMSPRQPKQTAVLGQTAHVASVVAFAAHRPAAMAVARAAVAKARSRAHSLMHLRFPTNQETLSPHLLAISRQTLAISVLTSNTARSMLRGIARLPRGAHRTGRLDNAVSVAPAMPSIRASTSSRRTNSRRFSISRNRNSSVLTLR